MLGRQPNILWFSDTHYEIPDFSEVGSVDLVVGLGDYAQRRHPVTQEELNERQIQSYLVRLCKTLNRLKPKKGKLLFKGNHEKEYVHEGNIAEMLLKSNGLVSENEKYVPVVYNNKNPQDAYWLFVKSMPEYEMIGRVSEELKDNAKFLCMVDHYKTLVNFSSDFDLSVSGHTHYKSMKVHQKKKGKKKKKKSNNYNYHDSLLVTFMNSNSNGSKKVKTADYNLRKDMFSKPIHIGNKISEGYGMQLFFLIDDNNFPKYEAPRMHLNLSNGGSWMKTSNGTQTLTIHSKGYTRQKQTRELYQELYQYLVKNNNKLSF